MSQKTFASPSVLFQFFFFSGFCGLVYQVVWVRLAFNYFGIITPVLSVVISVFMAGLGLGSWGGGKAATLWVSHYGRSALRLYGLIELGVGFLAAIVPFWLSLGSQRLLASGDMNSSRYLILSSVVLALPMLPACCFMGATYPVMMQYIGQIRKEHEKSFSFLYVANVLGAFCGTLLSACVLIELFGFRRTLFIAVACNTLIGITALILSQRSPIAQPSIKPVEVSEPSPMSRKELRLLLTALFTMGFVSMASEVIWTRTFIRVLGTTTYAFATVLAIYLAATTMGSLLYRRFSSFLTGPALMPWVALSAYLPILLNDPRWGLNLWGVFIGLAPFCGLAGAMTPYFVERLARGNAARAGWGYGVNIAGCVVGPLVASYLLLPYLGAKSGIAWLACPLLLLVPFYRSKRTSAVVLAGGLLISWVIFPNMLCYEEEAPNHLPAVLRRDYAATVISSGEGFHKSLLVNGVGITFLTPLTKMMAHLPVRAFPGRPHKALLICFGMGTTYRSLLSWQMPVTAVELVPSVKEAFPYYWSDANEVLRNPYGAVVIDDGRRYLSRSHDHYDIITLDPPPPVEASGSSFLYSREFYVLIKGHMTPNGILQQWWPVGETRILRAVARTLAQEFPYVRVYKGVGKVGYHFLASRVPITLRSADAFMESMPATVKADLLEWNSGQSLPSVIQTMVDHEIRLDVLNNTHDTAVITDDSPYNEYYLLRRWHDRYFPPPFPPNAY